MESANTVGYNAETLRAGKYNMVSIPFAGTTTATQSIKNALKVANPCGAETSDDADNLLVWGFNDQGIGGYVTYAYYADGTGQWDGWWDASMTYEFDDCAENAGGIEAGYCFWYLSRGATAPSVTVSGAVAGEDDISFTLRTGKYNMLCNPFPVNLKLNSWVDSTGKSAAVTGDKQVDWGSPLGADNSDDADNILVWGFNDQGIGGYVTYAYYADGTGDWDGWWDASMTYTFEQVSGNENGLSVGQAFWYLSNKAAGSTQTVTFYNPL